ncbi:hypothetical protein [Rhodoplanes azumiensis]|uniref:Uncharacterized protein n=1 Tax=Rhodoplanes azumiensis TaxID=1897628 RepID=A0ABW5ARD8_9BRAD
MWKSSTAVGDPGPRPTVENHMRNIVPGGLAAIALGLLLAPVAMAAPTGGTAIQSAAKSASIVHAVPCAMRRVCNRRGCWTRRVCW